MDILRSYTPPTAVPYNQAHRDYIFGNDAGILDYVLCPPSPESIADAIITRPRARRWHLEEQQPHGMPLWIPVDSLGASVACRKQEMVPGGPDVLSQGAAIVYTDGEYGASLESSDWSRGETDRLVELWNSLGGRIHIIADRFNAQAASKGDASAWRPVEDIRERLVVVMNSLADLRGSPHRRIVYDKGTLHIPLTLVSV